MSKLTEALDKFEAKMNIKTIDKKIKAHGQGAEEDGMDLGEHSWAIAEAFLDEYPKIKKWLEKNGYDATDYVSANL